MFNIMDVLPVKKESNGSVVDKILNALPSGSGFDKKWRYDRTTKSGWFIFDGGFHNMNSDGYYDGWTDLTLKVNVHDYTDFKLSLSNGKRKYMDSFHKEVYSDDIYYCLNNLHF